MALHLRRETALDLTLEGTVGSFRVGAVSGGSRSLEVKHLLTHVGLNFSTSSNDKLLSSLTPVREIFDFQSLDFDEIMQRDIDDARVSAELVPYLLDEQSKDMINLSCCRFHGHRIGCFGTGGCGCNDGSSAGSSSSRR